MNNLFKNLILLILSGFLFTGCSNDNKNINNNHSLVLEFDSISLRLKYKETLFVIPSPMQTTLLLKNSNLAFSPEMLAPYDIIEKYNTNFKKSIILGIYSANISYLNLYNQKELALKYFENIKKMMTDLELYQSFDHQLLENMMNNIGSNDSVTYYLSELYKTSTDLLKSNERWDLSTLIIAGGWVESFYYLNSLYHQTKNQQIFEIILYQEEALDNLIKIIAPFYEKSPEYTEFIDELINISYEFEVLDKEYKTIKITCDSTHKKTIIDNTIQYTFTGSKMEGLYQLIKNFRNKLIN